MDLGEVLLAIILLYGFTPGIGFILMENGAGTIDDNRLFNGFGLEQLEYIETLFLLFAGSFATIYIFVRNSVCGKIDHCKEITPLVWPVVIAAIALTALLIVISTIWGADVEDSYIGSYTKLRSTPILIQQFVGIGSQIQLALTIAAVAFAIAAWPKRHHYVAIALFANLTITVIEGGSRTNAFLAFLAYIVAASIYIPTFRVRRAALLAAPGLILFLLAGLFRDSGVNLELLSFFYKSEFTAVFVTPLDLHMRFPDGFSGQAPFNLYAVDLLRLIPSQLLPFEKISPSDWYSSNFYGAYYDQGGGFAFGVLSEIVLGQGIPEAVIRGGLLGALFALLANWLHTPNASPVKIVAYIWLMAIGYQCYRDTTFSIVARAFFHLLPVLIFIAILQTNRRAGATGVVPRIT